MLRHYICLWQNYSWWTLGPPAPAKHLITESGDTIVTEGGDQLTTEN